eukprot:363786-Chlamydomonas_euryale.AAC.9
MHATPSMIAMVAGTAPPLRTTASTSSAVCRFWGYGMPASFVDVFVWTAVSCGLRFLREGMPACAHACVCACVDAFVWTAVSCGL